MMERLTGAERQIALMICVFMAIVGLVMAAAGRGDPMGSHGAIVLIAAAIMTCCVLRAIGEPEPAEEEPQPDAQQEDEEHDDSSKSSKWWHVYASCH